MSPDHKSIDPANPFPGESRVPILSVASEAEMASLEARRDQAAKQEAKEAREKRELALAESTNKLALTNSIVTWVLAIFTAISAAAAIYQGCLASRAIEVARQANIQTLQISKDSSTDSSNQFQAQLRHFDDGLGRTGLIAKHAGDQAEAAKDAARAAKRAADIASDNLRKSQRPWVTAESFTPSTFTMAPQGRFYVDGDLILKNTGASVATNGWAMLEAIPNGTDTLSRDWDKPCRDVDEQISANTSSTNKTPWPIGFVLGPNQETRLRVGSGDPSGVIDKRVARQAPYTPFPSQDPKSGQFYLLGCSRYRDQFGVGHTTRFCFIYLNDKLSPSGFYICNALETAD